MISFTIPKILVTATVLMGMISGYQKPELTTSTADTNLKTPTQTLQSNNKANNQRLVMVFTTKGEITEVKKKADAITKLVSAQIGLPVEAVVSDETAAVEALRANRADIAFLSSRPALKAKELAGAKLYLAEVRPNYSGGQTYKSILFVKKTSPLVTKATNKETLAQLKGKKMAFASRTSGSGFIIPIADLINKGFVKSADRSNDFLSKLSTETDIPVLYKLC
jgi:phosphonate transport system substrate-binding protein